MGSFELTGVVLVVVGFALLYLGIGVVLNFIAAGLDLSFPKRLWLLVAWPHYFSSRQSIEDKREARELNAARQTYLREQRKRRGF